MGKIEKIPTNVFTGLLGVGKTTALLDLLSRKPGSERWAILVNEFGEVPIDQAAFEGPGDRSVFVREVAGGCLCCTAGVPLQVAVALLVRRARPDRLLVEMSGIGHIGLVLRSLREGRLSETLDLRSTFTLVDPRDAADTEIRSSRTFLDQVHLADVILPAKADLSDREDLREMLRWARGLFPPKRLVAEDASGGIDPAWLDFDIDPSRVPLFPDLHAHGKEDRAPPTDPLPDPVPGEPVRAESEGFDRHACGWIFSPEDTFDPDRLLECVAGAGAVERLKGVFRVGGEWIAVDRAGEDVHSRPTAYCRDSRVEVIASEPPDWDAFEQELLSCLRPRNVLT